MGGAEAPPFIEVTSAYRCILPHGFLFHNRVKFQNRKTRKPLRRKGFRKMAKNGKTRYPLRHKG